MSASREFNQALDALGTRPDVDRQTLNMVAGVINQHAGQRNLSLRARLERLEAGDGRYTVIREAPGQTHTRQAGDIIIRRSYGADLRQHTPENDSSTHQGKTADPC